MVSFSSPTRGLISYCSQSDIPGANFSNSNLELIGNTVLTVYRGTGTVLRATSGAPSNEFAQFNSATGAITVSYGFSDGESLWVEYRTI